jgi:hypothetical protein
MCVDTLHKGDDDDNDNNNNNRAARHETPHYSVFAILLFLPPS